MRLHLLAASLMAVVHPAAAQDYLPAPVLAGVYECFGPGTYTLDDFVGQHGSAPQAVQPISAVGLMFGLIDGTRAKNFDNETGSYSYDTASGVLALRVPGCEIRYRRTADRAFRVLDVKGEMTGISCPLNAAKDPNAPPW